MHIRKSYKKDRPRKQPACNYFSIFLSQHFGMHKINMHISISDTCHRNVFSDKPSCMQQRLHRTEKKRKIGRIQRKLRFINPSNALFEGLLDKPGEPAGSLRGTPIDECFDLVARRMSAAPQILR